MPVLNEAVEAQADAIPAPAKHPADDGLMDDITYLIQ